MARLLLVDAYNAMFRLWPDAPADRDQARRMLVTAAEEALRVSEVARGDDRVLLVFDAHPGAERAGLQGRGGRVSWRYARGSADDEILEHLRRGEGSAGNVVVVTDDRELKGRARQLGASTASVGDLFRGPRRLATPDAPPRGAPVGPPLGPTDFDLPAGEIDLTDPDLEDLA